MRGPAGRGDACARAASLEASKAGACTPRFRLLPRCPPARWFLADRPFPWREPFWSQAQAKRAVCPAKRVAPPKSAEPRQADQENRRRTGTHAQRSRRADNAGTSAQAEQQRVAEMVDIGGKCERMKQRGFQRAAREEHAEETEPKPDRARAAQAAAVRENGLGHAPEKGDEPDGRSTEPAENYRVHARNQE